MWGPEMAPHTPPRSERPGEPGPLLDHPMFFGCAHPRPSGTGATTSSAQRLSTLATRRRASSPCSAAATSSHGSAQSAMTPVVPATLT